MSSGVRVAAIVAMDEQRLIGAGGALPWHIPEDLKRFRDLTKGNIVIMGRKTWESLPVKVRPLPDRTNIVISRRIKDLDLPAQVLGASSPEEALIIARQAARAGQIVWVIGGAEVYKAFLPLCDEIHLTCVRGVHEGDAWLPQFEDAFRLQSEESGERCSFRTYVRGSERGRD